MKITLDNNDVEKALIAYVGSLGIDIDGCDFDIQTVKGRKTGDLIADIEITRGGYSTANPNVNVDDDPVEYKIPEEIPTTTRPLFDPTSDAEPEPSEEFSEDKDANKKAPGLNFLA